MNELQVISLQIKAIFAADARIDELFAGGKISAEEREIWQDANRAQRERLRFRREKLDQTGDGITPILSTEQAERLRAAVRDLQEANATAQAIEALLNEALTIAGAVAGRASATFSAAGAQVVGSAPSRAASSRTPSLGASATLAIVSVVAIVALALVARGETEAA